MERLVRSPSPTYDTLSTTYSAFLPRLPSNSERIFLSPAGFRRAPFRVILPHRPILTYGDSYPYINGSSRKFSVWASESGPPPAGSGRDASGSKEMLLSDPTKETSFHLLKKACRAGLTTLLSSLIIMLIQPAFTKPALATVQTVTTTGSAAVRSMARTELFTSAWAGFFAGCLHTLSGPDHLAALAPLSIGCTRMESAAVGALWGCGHDAGQVLFGLLFLLLKDKLHIEVLRTWGTRVVGMTLLIIGAMGIREATEVPTPCFCLENGECVAEATEATIGKKKIGFATFATGVIHGLQPDALMMVLPALALPSRFAGASFLGMFLVGTVFAMSSYTVFIGSCSQALKERVPRITEKLTWASSLVAIALGIAIIVSELFGYSLY